MAFLVLRSGTVVYVFKNHDVTKTKSTFSEITQKSIPVQINEVINDL